MHSAPSATSPAATASTSCRTRRTRTSTTSTRSTRTRRRSRSTARCPTTRPGRRWPTCSTGRPPPCAAPRCSRPTRNTGRRSASRGPVARFLDGIRVIDAASFIAGPVATTVMADFGADVIKIEPPSGDTYRTRGPGYPPSPYNFPWLVDNRSKRGLALDLRTADGQRVLHRLVRDADVFVTNAPLDSRGRLGVRWEDLAPRKPGLVYGAITAYGET